MNNKFKRLLAVLFSLSMVFCLMSANAWADGEPTAAEDVFTHAAEQVEQFKAVHYNQHTKGEELEAEDKYYVTVANNVPDTLNSIKINGTDYTPDDVKTSVGNNAFVKFKVFKVSNGSLKLALPDGSDGFGYRGHPHHYYWK